jgi:hypothetical protein
MNKLCKKLLTFRLLLLTVVVLAGGTLTPAKASDNGWQLGVRAGANLNSYWSNSFVRDLIDIDYEMGFGIDAGLTAKHFLTNRLSLYSELSFCHGKLVGYYADDVYYDYEYGDSVWWEAKGSVYEIALLLPVMVQYTPIISVPLYVSGGIQLGVPFTILGTDSYRFATLDGETLSDTSVVEKGYDDHRSFVDFGVALGIGCTIIPKLDVDFRYVINLNNVWGGWNYKDYSRTTLMYFILGVNYFI